MGTIVIDTNILAPAVVMRDKKYDKEQRKRRRKVLAFLTSVEEYKVKIGTDSKRIIESQYHAYISKDPDLQNWWGQMKTLKLVEKYVVSRRGEYPDDAGHSLDEVDKALLDVASMTDTKILVTEDSDFYQDKSLKAPHYVVEKRGVKLKKLNEAYHEVREWDP